jgi:hypothetical protein
VKSIAATLSLLLSITTPAAAFATTFSDVPPTYPYALAIAELNKRGIILGDNNGDGSKEVTTFRPHAPLNRAELLTLLYRASGRTARAVYSACFPDVPVAAWFSAVVCTAFRDAFVKGYPDGYFRPENVVVRVEALKMILNVLGFTVPELSQDDRLSLDFLGVTHGSWYAPFLHRALTLQLIPEEMLRNNTFIPDAKLLRGEAAEMMYRALSTDDLLPGEDVPQEEGIQEDVTPTGATLVAFPLHRTGTTGQRGASSYAFDLEDDGTVLVEAANLSVGGTISCYLYLLGSSGFSSEFFIGYEEGSSCFIRGALRAGHYQLEVRTKAEGEEYSLDADPSSGDGNDGFIEATSLRVGYPRAGVLPAHDYEDWFRFTIATQAARRVDLSTSANLTCTIFPGADVDLFGEEGPACEKTYTYPPGTYYISVKRPPPATSSLSYTIQLR